MTDQIDDYFIYKGDTGYLHVNTLGKFPEPQDFGMEVKVPFTACYKGYMFMLSLAGNQLVLHTMFINSEIGNKINNIEPLIIPNNLHEIESELPYIPPKYNITASYILNRVISTEETLGLFLHHFPQIYTNINFPIDYTGTIIIVMQLKKIYDQFLSSYRKMTGNKKNEEKVPDLTEKQGEKLQGLLLDNDLLTEKMIEIFETNPKLNATKVQEILDLFDYTPYILLNFKDGKLVGEQQLTYDQFNSESDKIFKSFL